MPWVCTSEAAAYQTFFVAPGPTGPGQTFTTRAIPWYSFPGRYLFSGGYYMNLSITEMRIDHVSEDSRCTRKNRTFMISASFAQPIGNRLFSSSFEFPVLSADRLMMSRLETASIGDYIVHLSNTPLLGSASQMLISARF